MIKLIEVEPKGDCQLALRFSDGAAGVLDFAPFVDTNTPMTAPLRDPAFFARHSIELGALAWPNGLDFSAGSLHRRLEGVGKLVHDRRVAELLAGGYVASASPPGKGDLSDWLELMEVVEALCPVWPERDGRGVGWNYKL